LREIRTARLTVSPSPLGAFIEREWKENQCPADSQEDKTDSVDLHPPVPGELPPGETFLLVVNASIVRRGSERENSQLLGLDIGPEKDHKGRSHNCGHDDL
jgi:hypothetical protein